MLLLYICAFWIRCSGGDSCRLRLGIGFHLFIFTHFVSTAPSLACLGFEGKVRPRLCTFTVSRIGMGEGSLKTLHLTVSQDRKTGFYQCNTGCRWGCKTYFLQLFKFQLKTKIPPGNLSPLRSKCVSEEQITKYEILDVAVKKPRHLLKQAA